MKRLLLPICLLALACVFISSTDKPERRKVVYSSNVDCESCQKKVLENIAFEKGVKDVSVDIEKETVSIVFDESKTDTLKLSRAIRRLGYEAKVIKFE